MRCPTPLAASMRLPAPMTSMSAIVTPASSRAASAASAPRSMRSLSGYRPNFVIDAPRIQTSRSAIACSFSPSGRLVAELDRLGALVVDAGDRGNLGAREGGGAGIRAGLRSRCPSGLGGSSPSARTRTQGASQPAKRQQDVVDASLRRKRRRNSHELDLAYRDAPPRGISD